MKHFVLSFLNNLLSRVQCRTSSGHHCALDCPCHCNIDIHLQSTVTPTALQSAGVEGGGSCVLFDKMHRICMQIQLCCGHILAVVFFISCI